MIVRVHECSLEKDYTQSMSSQTVLLRTTLTRTYDMSPEVKPFTKRTNHLQRKLDRFKVTKCCENTSPGELDRALFAKVLRGAKSYSNFFLSITLLIVFLGNAAFSKYI